PEITIQKKIYQKILNKYGLEVFFEKINGSDDRGINKLTFFKGNNRFNEPGEVYIYWNVAKKNIIIEQKTVKERVYSPKRDEKQLQAIKKIKYQEPAPVKKENKKLVHTKAENPRKNVEKKIIIAPSNIEKPQLVKKSKICIVIDDAGYQYEKASLFFESGLNITYALIPGLNASKQHYTTITNHGHDLILHIPMEPEKGRDFVEKEAVLTTMSDNEINVLINRFFNEYPKALGANNHMGSKAVKDARVMNSAISVIKKRDLFWLDSLTSPGSVADEVASIQGVPYLSRDVFLDNENSEKYINDAMVTLIKIAKRRGYAIGIGHLQSDVLIKVLKEYYSRSNELSIEFVGIHSIIN
ncbi:MAG: hypothetical protein A2355_01320, partial [Spirochaetes bacterium RIFOXYB1_FULL_32_8]